MGARSRDDLVEGVITLLTDAPLPTGPAMTPRKRVEALAHRIVAYLSRHPEASPERWKEERDEFLDECERLDGSEASPEGAGEPDIWLAPQEVEMLRHTPRMTDSTVPVYFGHHAPTEDR